VSPGRQLEKLRERVRSRPVDEEAERWLAIAREVADQRRARALSQHELADLCGTTQSAIARLERGARPPRLDTLLRIANALDCELVVELRPRTKTRGRKR
jgi:transcriptional regulator with XRE-family HTH domain